MHIRKSDDAKKTTLKALPFGVVFTRCTARKESVKIRFDYESLTVTPFWRSFLWRSPGESIKLWCRCGRARIGQQSTGLIRRADVVWIQTNAISHGYYYKIIDEVRKYDVRVRYFSYASAQKCAEQIVADEKAMNK